MREMFVMRYPATSITINVKRKSMKFYSARHSAMHSGARGTEDGDELGARTGEGRRQVESGCART